MFQFVFTLNSFYIHVLFFSIFPTVGIIPSVELTPSKAQDILLLGVRVGTPLSQ